MPDGGEFSEDDLATREAAMADMDPAEMQARMLTGMVVRLLQTKTGEMPTGGPGGGMGMGSVGPYRRGGQQPQAAQHGDGQRKAPPRNLSCRDAGVCHGAFPFLSSHSLMTGWLDGLITSIEQP